MAKFDSMIAHLKRHREQQLKLLEMHEAGELQSLKRVGANWVDNTPFVIEDTKREIEEWDRLIEELQEAQ